MAELSAADVIRILDLKPHPEGGHYRETFRDDRGDGARAASTAIYFLLAEGEVSRWHRVDAAEVWHWRTPAGRGGARLLAKRSQSRRLDAGRLHGGAGIRVREIRDGGRRIFSAAALRCCRRCAPRCCRQTSQMRFPPFP